MKYTIKETDLESVIKEANKLRRNNKDSWIVIEIPAFNAVFKTYNTYTQIFKRNGIQHSFPMDLPVKVWIRCLRNSLTYEAQ